ncbi:cystathionine gamma-lyase-like [Macrosteles quadrilineatus]|uniref:cystathionine gamma-lyase-like n=1 Tax=Macrosteles quadrilineatus TaxID=74068 RepID=UPI0023E0A232|nr:cystathionine gamma-lyase-like [Macrosteles quadrilineatus]
MSTNENGYRKKDLHFATKAIHAGSEAEQWKSMAVVPPISLSTTFKQYGPADFEQYEYSRSGNPTRTCLQRCLASLDDAKYGLCYSSGLGATTAIVSLLSAGDHMLSVDDIYGGTGRLFRSVAQRFNISTTFAEGVDAEKFCQHLQPNTKLVWVESPTNPLLKVMDIPRIASLIKAYNKDIIFVVDNTFLTSYFQKPLALGADIVVYSATKYLNGHSDVVMGAVTTNNDGYYDRLKFLQNAMGIVPSPFDCYLVLRSLKTLKLRMEQHMKNSLAVAEFLESHPLVEKVMHPGLPSHPQHEVARRVWSGCSGMLSVYVRGGLDETKAFLSALKVITLAESLGGYESLADHPELMTHASVPADVRKQLGITSNLVRLSIGLESVEDLIRDLDQALQAGQKIKKS